MKIQNSYFFRSACVETFLRHDRTTFFFALNVHSLRNERKKTLKKSNGMPAWALEALSSTYHRCCRHRCLSSGVMCWNIHTRRHQKSTNFSWMSFGQFSVCWRRLLIFAYRLKSEVGHSKVRISRDSSKTFFIISSPTVMELEGILSIRC